MDPLLPSGHRRANQWIRARARHIEGVKDVSGIDRQGA